MLRSGLGSGKSGGLGVFGGNRVIFRPRLRPGPLGDLVFWCWR